LAHPKTFTEIAGEMQKPGGDDCVKLTCHHRITGSIRALKKSISTAMRSCSIIESGWLGLKIFPAGTSGNAADRPAIIRLASARKLAASRLLTCKPPRLINNHCERGQFVLPYGY